MATARRSQRHWSRTSAPNSNNSFRSQSRKNSDGIPDSCDVDNGSEDCDANGVPDECQDDCDGDGIPDACETVCVDSFDLDWNFDACYAFVGDGEFDYSEFTATQGGSCANVSATPSNVYRQSDAHSCTDDRFGNPGRAMCVGTRYVPGSTVINNFIADDYQAVRFNVSLSETGGTPASLAELSFWQAAPDLFAWMAA